MKQTNPLQQFLKPLLLVAIVIAIPLTIIAAQQTQQLNTQAQSRNIQNQTRETISPQSGTNQVQVNTLSSPAVDTLNYKGPCESAALQVGGAQIENPLCLSPNLDGAKRAIAFGIQLLLVAAVLITFAMLLLGGLSYITSAGDQQKAQGAKGKITYGIIGLFISVMSLTIISVVGETLGFSLFYNLNTTERAVNEAVRQEQRQAQQSCRTIVEEAASRGRPTTMQQCLRNYCANRYPGGDNVRKREDCIQLTQGVYDTNLNKELKGIQDYCSNNTQSENFDYDSCVRSRCSFIYRGNETNIRNCTNYLLQNRKGPY